MLILPILVILLLVGAIVTQGFSSVYLGSVKNHPATKAAMDFVNKQIAQFSPNAKVELVSAKILKGLISLSVKIDEEPLEAYVTKDGTLFFPQAIPLTTTTTKAVKVKKSDKVEAKLFTMSYCPFGNEAETAMIPVAKLLGKSVDIVPHYVIYSNYPSPDKFAEYCIDKDAKYCSMHGIQEVRQNVRELCIWKYAKASYWDYITLVNEKCTVETVNWCWKSLATELKIDTAKIETCLATEAETLLAPEVKLNTDLKVEGSPMMFVNGVEFNGDRSAEAYKNAICDTFTKSKRPVECNTPLVAPANTGTTTAGSCK